MRALAPSLAPNQIRLHVDRIIGTAGSSFDPQALSFIDSLPQEHTRAAVERILRGLANSTNTARRSALVGSLSSIAARIAPEEIDFVIENTHGRINQSSIRGLPSALVSALQAFAPRLTPSQVERMLNVSLASKSENPEQIVAHIDIVRILAPKLTLEQAPLAFDRVLKTSRPDTPPERAKAILAASLAILTSVTELAQRAPRQEVEIALGKLLNCLRDFDRERSRTNTEQTRIVVTALDRLVELARMFAAGDAPKQMHASLGVMLGILGGGGNNVGSPRFINSLEIFLPRLSEEHAKALSSITRARLALAVSPREGELWAHLINVELRRRRESDHVREVIKIVKYPGAVGEPTSVLLSGLRQRFELPLQGEPNLRELIELVKSRFPDLQGELLGAAANPSPRGSAAKSVH
jgi:hypothetical protein